MLLAHGERGDRQRAFELLRLALATARELGMKLLLERVMALDLRPEDLAAAGVTTAIDAVVPTIPAAGEEAGGPATPRTALLRREGDYWTLGYAGTSCRLKDSKGLQYLAHLLEHPGREFHVLDLIQNQGLGVTDSGRANPGPGPDTRHQRPGTINGGVPILDATAKAAYRGRLAELHEELAEAEQFNDAGRMERLRAEIQAITEQVAAAVGLGGRDRTALSAAQRARSTVTQRIRAAIQRISTHSPALADHLTNRVKTGTFCVYRPDPNRPIDWEHRRPFCQRAHSARAWCLPLQCNAECYAQFVRTSHTTGVWWVAGEHEEKTDDGCTRAATSPVGVDSTSALAGARCVDMGANPVSRAPTGQRAHGTGRHQ
jgi:hypothetical protein